MNTTLTKLAEQRDSIARTERARFFALLLKTNRNDDLTAREISELTELYSRHGAGVPIADAASAISRHAEILAVMKKLPDAKRAVNDARAAIAAHDVTVQRAKFKKREIDGHELTRQLLVDRKFEAGRAVTSIEHAITEGAATEKKFPELFGGGPILVGLAAAARRRHVRHAMSNWTGDDDGVAVVLIEPLMMNRECYGPLAGVEFVATADQTQIELQQLVRLVQRITSGGDVPIRYLASQGDRVPSGLDGAMVRGVTLYIENLVEARSLEYPSAEIDFVPFPGQSDKDMRKMLKKLDDVKAVGNRRESSWVGL